MRLRVEPLFLYRPKSNRPDCVAILARVLLVGFDGCPVLKGKTRSAARAFQKVNATGRIAQRGQGLYPVRMIGLIDYGAGNLRSVHRALVKVGAQVQLITDPEAMPGCDAVVLPGVGAFDDCLNALDRSRMFAACREFIATGKPFLGICVGYQALFERSHEFNSKAPGLGIFKGEVVRFPETQALKVPQIGWNQIEIVQPACPLYRGLPNRSYVYFVHSFFPVPEDLSITATWTDYGCRFASSVWRDNVYATQFHPEKSQQVGLRLLTNFVELTT